MDLTKSHTVRCRDVNALRSTMKGVLCMKHRLHAPNSDLFETSRKLGLDVMNNFCGREKKHHFMSTCVLES